MDGEAHGRGRGDLGKDFSFSEGREEEGGWGGGGDNVDGCSAGWIKMSVSKPTYYRAK